VSTPSGADAWSALRARLEAEGFRPSRSLGQNFLRDVSMARAIARDSLVTAGDFVLEVGPGCCMLSLQLLERGANLLAVEIDARLARVARERLASPVRGSAEVLECDVLAGKHALAPSVLARLPRAGPWHVVANLPYSAGTPFLVLCSRLPNPPSSATVLLQRELVERLCAQPGGKAWGPVGARLRLVYRIESLRRVGPELFWPRPKVDSAVARLTLANALPGPERVAAFDRLVDGLFQARRKALAGRLADLWGDRGRAAAVLAELGIDPLQRVESLSPEQLLKLADRSPRSAGEAPV
jgi:16S rRNA (adenine1518-N6/adenine1519-N6)-dimethyltransferase